MATAPEIYRTVTLLIEQFGEMAPVGAFLKADQMRQQGDQGAHALWLRVGRVAEDLLAEDRPIDATLH